LEVLNEFLEHCFLSLSFFLYLLYHKTPRLSRGFVKVFLFFLSQSNVNAVRGQRVFPAHEHLARRILF
jgi:hypothetical protein